MTSLDEHRREIKAAVDRLDEESELVWLRHEVEEMMRDHE